jgi:hypothetical protein
MFSNRLQRAILSHRNGAESLLEKTQYRAGYQYATSDSMIRRKFHKLRTAKVAQTSVILVTAIRLVNWLP